MSKRFVSKLEVIGQHIFCRSIFLFAAQCTLMLSHSSGSSFGFNNEKTRNLNWFYSLLCQKFPLAVFGVQEVQQKAEMESNQLIALISFLFLWFAVLQVSISANKMLSSIWRQRHKWIKICNWNLCKVNAFSLFTKRLSVVWWSSNRSGGICNWADWSDYETWCKDSIHFDSKRRHTMELFSFRQVFMTCPDSAIIAFPV